MIRIAALVIAARALVEPYGLDISPELADLARSRLLVFQPFEVS